MIVVDPPRGWQYPEVPEESPCTDPNEGDPVPLTPRSDSAQRDEKTDHDVPPGHRRRVVENRIDRLILHSRLRTLQDSGSRVANGRRNDDTIRPITAAAPPDECVERLREFERAARWALV